jgi:hypothetical protein
MLTYSVLIHTYINLIFRAHTELPGARGSVVVKAPCYKPEGRDEMDFFKLT